MNPKTHKSPVLCIVALLAILALTSLACSFSAFGVRPYSPDVDVDLSEIDIPEINVTIREAQFNHLSPHADIHIGSYCGPLDEVNRIELHDGFIRFVGTRHQWGAADVDGSLDLSLSSENNMLKAKLIAVDIPGLTLDDPCIVEANQEVEKALIEMVTDSHGEVLFKEVVVEEGVLRMKIQVHIDE
jgi:hypothetical protein